MNSNDTNTQQASELRNLWISMFKDIFIINNNDIKSKLIEPKDKEYLAKKLVESKPEHVKISSGSGAFRVAYTSAAEDLKNLFIKGYYHKRLFDTTNLYKRFSVAKLTPSQLCISNTRIFNEIIMNYLMKKITETDTTIDDKDKNNIHIYDFIYTPDKDTVYIAQPAIGHKALIADYKIVTTLKELLEIYYIKLKEDIATPHTLDKHDTSLNDINRIAVALCNTLKPYLETLQKLRKKYKFVHTDLHFGNIFIKSKEDSEKKQVSIYQNELIKPVTGSLPQKPTIHEQLINDLENCVLLIADYDLARMTVKPDIFTSTAINMKDQIPDITDIDFKSIFIEKKAIEKAEFGVNVVPKKKKKLQKKETVIRTRCAYEEYDSIYKGLYPIEDDKKCADMLIYSNWDILSIFINVTAFLKKCEYKIYKGAAPLNKEVLTIYTPIIRLFQSYVVNPIKQERIKHHIIGNNIITYFYACMNYMYRDKSLGNWFAFLFEGKFSFITRVFDKFKNDYHDTGILTATYISESEGPKDRTIFKKLYNIFTRKAKQNTTRKLSNLHNSTRATSHAAAAHMPSPKKGISNNAGYTKVLPRSRTIEQLVAKVEELTDILATVNAEKLPYGNSTVNKILIAAHNKRVNRAKVNLAEANVKLAEAKKELNAADEELSSFLASSKVMLAEAKKELNAAEEKFKRTLINPTSNGDHKNEPALEGEYASIEELKSVPESPNHEQEKGDPRGSRQSIKALSSRNATRNKAANTSSKSNLPKKSTNTDYITHNSRSQSRIASLQTNIPEQASFTKKKVSGVKHEVSPSIYERIAALKRRK